MEVDSKIDRQAGSTSDWFIMIWFSGDLNADSIIQVWPLH